MKNFVLFVGMAVLAVTVASGCGKFSKCSEATKKEDCTNTEKFEKGVSCEWAGEKCVDKKTPPKDQKDQQKDDEKAAKEVADKACEDAANDTEDKCKAATAKAGANYECKWDAAAAKKCTASKKAA